MEKHEKILKKSRRIAIVRTDKLGDMVLTLPMLNAIKESVPNADVDIIASSYTEVLLKGQGLINQFHFVDKIDGGIDRIFKLNHYDAVFFPRPRFDEIFAAFKHRIPLRIGSGYRWYSFLLNHKVYEHRRTAEKNEAQYNVDLVNDITKLKHKAKLIKPNFDSKIDIYQKIPSMNSSNGLIIIHPGGGGSAPKWSADKFGQLAKLIINNHDLNVLITGTPDESSLALEVQNITDGRVINLCGLLNLEEMIALMNESKCLIANSTGVLHIAAAVGISVMGFYPNTPSMSSKRWGALTDRAKFLSPPLSDDITRNDDLQLIPSEVAYSAFKELCQKF